MTNLADVYTIALSLDHRERATLAERLLASLDDLPEEEAERLWVEEAQSRLEDFRAGRAKAIDSTDVHTKANRLLR